MLGDRLKNADDVQCIERLSPILSDLFKLTEDEDVYHDKVFSVLFIFKKLKWII